MGSKSQQMAYASAFSHENETAEPGYYSVFLDRYVVKAELTSTKRAAIHRYTFPKALAVGRSGPPSSNAMESVTSV